MTTETLERAGLNYPWCEPTIMIGLPIVYLIMMIVTYDSLDQCNEFGTPRKNAIAAIVWPLLIFVVAYWFLSTFIYFHKNSIVKIFLRAFGRNI